jgi:transposase-like protein
MSLVPQLPAQGHLKLRYPFRRVCKIFGVHPDTLHRWLREGIPIGNGRKIRIHYVPLGPRRKEFEIEEVERVYQELRASSVEEADVLDFPDESDRDERRARAESRGVRIAAKDDKD